MSARDWARSTLGLELVQQLGAGTWGIVYEARDLGHGPAWRDSRCERVEHATWAVKVIEFGFRADGRRANTTRRSEAYEDFRAELGIMQALQRAQVPGIVKLHHNAIQTDARCVPVLRRP